MKQTLTLLFLLATLPAFAQTQATTSTTVEAKQTPSLKEYAGTYSFPGGGPLSKFTILEKDGILYGEADSYGSYKLDKQAEAETYKSTSSYGSIIVFERDSGTKTIKSLVLKVQGQEITATKDK